MAPSPAICHITEKFPACDSVCLEGLLAPIHLPIPTECGAQEAPQTSLNKMMSQGTTRACWSRASTGHAHSSRLRLSKPCNFLSLTLTAHGAHATHTSARSHLVYLCSHQPPSPPSWAAVSPWQSGGRKDSPHSTWRFKKHTAVGRSGWYRK